MVRYAAELPVDVIEANIASAIDLVVQTRRALDGSRFVSDVVTLSFDREAGRCRAHCVYARPLGESEGSWEAAPGWMNDLSLLGIASEEEVAAWKRACSLD